VSGQPHVAVALTQYPLNRRLGGPHRRCGRFWGRNVSCPCRDMLPYTDRCSSTSYNCAQKSCQPQSDCIYGSTTCFGLVDHHKLVQVIRDIGRCQSLRI